MTRSLEDVYLSGSGGKLSTSTRAGYLPISLGRTPLEAFAGIPVYLRTSGRDGTAAYTMYAAAHVRFSDAHRRRLEELDVKFVYIPIEAQGRFRRQVEELLESVVADAALASSTKAELVYETSVELMNELLADPSLAAANPRLAGVCRAVATLVINDPASFEHLFTTSYHDFYTATHMVNVGTWMVPLAHAMGIRRPDALAAICKAGMLHDIGKMYVTEAVLNKKERLDANEWAAIRAHPVRGVEHLREHGQVEDVVLEVTAQHHERLDGSGYPLGLKGEAIGLAARICAVVDSFDAMTAFRPYKESTMSVDQALEEILKGTPARFDPAVVEAWLGVLGVKRSEMAAAGAGEADRVGRRHEARFRIQCPVRVQVMEHRDGTWVRREASQGVATSISERGLGFLSIKPVRVGEYLEVRLTGGGTLDRTVEGMVVRCRAYGDGWYEVGLKQAAVAAEEAGVVVG